MASYESDSSGAEDVDYTETNVLLGYASKEPSDDIISHLGGRPVGSMSSDVLWKRFEKGSNIDVKCLS